MELVHINNSRIITTSRIIAETFWREHKNILKGIEKLLDEEKDDKDFVANFLATKYKLRWKLETEYYITQDWFTFLVMWFTWKKAREFKKQYIKAFNKLKEIVNWLETHKLTDEYKQARLEWKIVRRKFTDVLKELEIYAKSEDLNANTKFIYSTYTKVINKNLFNIEGKFKNIRNVCNSQQIKNLDTIEVHLADIIIKQIDSKVLWKDIYVIVKDKMEAYSNLFSKTEVILNQKQLCEKKN